MRRVRRDRRVGRFHRPADLDITAFMNLMVVLVPFLLIMAVFSRMTVLQLDMPSESRTARAQASDFSLQVTVRENVIEVADRRRGELARFPFFDGSSDLTPLGEYLAELKQQHPDARSAAILLEPGVSYQSIVAVLDRVRERTANGRSYSLFPAVALGDAPLLTAASAP